jgi:hypothetical protein
MPFSTCRHNLVISMVKNRELIVIRSSSVSCLVSQYFMEIRRPPPSSSSKSKRRKKRGSRWDSCLAYNDIPKTEVVFCSETYDRNSQVDSICGPVCTRACVCREYNAQKNKQYVCGRSVLPCSSDNPLLTFDQNKPGFMCSNECTDKPYCIRPPPPENSDSTI